MFQLILKILSLGRLEAYDSDMLPIVKQSNSARKVWYNTGHGHLGWTLSAYTANRIANQILKIS